MNAFGMAVDPNPRGSRAAAMRRGTLNRWPLFALSSVAIILSVIPTGFVISSTISAGWHTAKTLIWRPRVGELLANTTKLTLACVLASIVIGVGAAWLVERTNLPGRQIWNVLLAAPLAVPAFVNSFGWVSITSSVEGYAGATLIVTMSYYPLVYLPVMVSLRGLDPALEEVANGLGYGPWKTFGKVILPQLRPAILGGGLLVGLHLLAEFGALQMLRFPTFTTAIYDQYRSTFSGPAANMLASVLVLCCLLLLITELRLRGNRRYSRIGSGNRRSVVRKPLGGYTIPSLAAVTLLIVLALGVPMGSLLHWLVVGSSTAFPIGDLLITGGTSVGLAAAAAVGTTLIALPVAWLAVRHRSAATTTLERSTYFGNALPGIVVALALVTVSLRFVPAIYQTVWLLLAAYAIVSLPRAMISVKAAILQAPPLFEDVAHALGDGSARTFWRVTVPLIAPGLGVSAALVFLAIVNELTATLLLAPIGTRTLATQFWSNSSNVAYGAAAPYAALMVLISLPATFLLTRHVERSDVS